MGKLMTALGLGTASAPSSAEAETRTSVSAQLKARVQAILEKAAAEEKNFNGNQSHQKEKRNQWQRRVLSDLSMALYDGKRPDGDDFRGERKNQLIIRICREIERRFGDEARAVRRPNFLTR